MALYYNYKAFDLVIESKDLLIDELLQVDNSLKPDVIIKKGDSKEWPKLTTNKFNTPVLAMVPGDIRLDIKNICKFRIHDGKYIYWDPIYDHINFNELNTFLLGTPLGGLLIQRNHLVMHGNALAKNNKAIICLGNSGQGKSTLAYILMKRGWKLISDDIVVIDEDGFVLPGIPRIKLWSDALDYFNINPKSLKRVRQNIQKYLITKSYLDIQKEKVNLKNIFIINRSFNKFVKHENLKVVSSESEQNTLLHLRNYCYRPIFVKGLGNEGINFLKISKILKKIKLSILPVPENLDKLSTWISDKKLL